MLWLDALKLGRMHKTGKHALKLVCDSLKLGKDALKLGRMH